MSDCDGVHVFIGVDCWIGIAIIAGAGVVAITALMVDVVLFAHTVSTELRWRRKRPDKQTRHANTAFNLPKSVPTPSHSGLDWRMREGRRQSLDEAIDIVLEYFLGKSLPQKQ